MRMVHLYFHHSILPNIGKLDLPLWRHFISSLKVQPEPETHQKTDCHLLIGEDQFKIECSLIGHMRMWLAEKKRLWLYAGSRAIIDKWLYAGRRYFVKINSVLCTLCAERPNRHLPTPGSQSNVYKYNQLSDSVQSVISRNAAKWFMRAESDLKYTTSP